MVPPHLQQHRTPNISPYPHIPPNYHYHYPPPSSLNPDENSAPPVYEGSAYPETYSGDSEPPSENSNSKAFEEESSGEFGGLVSYFSSQREDDLDT